MKPRTIPNLIQEDTPYTVFLSPQAVHICEKLNNSYSYHLRYIGHIILVCILKADLSILIAVIVSLCGLL